MSQLSTFLFAQPSFFEGFGRAIDLGDTLTEYNRAQSPLQADRAALMADWQSVGDSIRDSRESYSSAHAKLTE